MKFRLRGICQSQELPNWTSYAFLFVPDYLRRRSCDSAAAAAKAVKVLLYSSTTHRMSC